MPALRKRFRAVGCLGRKGGDRRAERQRSKDMILRGRGRPDVRPPTRSYSL